MNNSILDGNLVYGTDHEEGIFCNETSPSNSWTIVPLQNIENSTYLTTETERIQGIIQDVNVFRITRSIHNITAGDFAVDVDTLYVDESTDRVGIGTETPTDTLEIVGGMDISGNASFPDNVGLELGSTVPDFFYFNGSCTKLIGQTATLEVC